MRRNCNLELCLVPPPPTLYSDGNYDHHHHNDRQEQSMEKMNAIDEDSKEKQKQQLTIFYDGRVSVLDVTELQARAIIMLASQEMEEKWKSVTPGSATSDPSSPLIPSQMYSPSGLSMKRSLQRFLQKRKHRIQATSPYHHH